MTSTLRNKGFTWFAACALLAAPAVWAQSTRESLKDGANDVGREAKKGANRVEEAFCTGTKAECAAQKAKNRGQETKDAASDKAKEIKDKVDRDGK